MTNRRNAASGGRYPDTVIRRFTRPLTASERADLERPIVDSYEFHPFMLVIAAGYLLGLLLGAGMLAASIASFLTLQFQSAGARVVLIVLAIAGVVVGAIAVAACGRGLWGLRPYRTRVIRAARSLSNAVAQIIEIPVAHAWRFDAHDEDSAMPLLIRTPQRTYVFIDSDGLFDLYEQLRDDMNGRPMMLGPTIVIERFENTDLGIATEPGAVAVVTVDLTGEHAGDGALEALYELPSESELDEHRLPPLVLDRLARETERGAAGASDAPRGAGH